MTRKSKVKKVCRKARSAGKRKRKSEINNRAQISKTVEWLIDEKIFAGVRLHGNTTWQCRPLVSLAMLWLWSSMPQLTEAFNDARIKATTLWGDVPVTTYQGLLKALTSSTAKLMPLLQIRMHELLAKIGGKWMYFEEWVPIAMDGTTACAPWTNRNELELRSPTHGQGKNAKHREPKTKKSRGSKTTNPKSSGKINPPSPQVWLTMMWHMRLGVPWCWKVGPVHEAERMHVREMLETNHFVDKTLFVGDAGFVGYDFWNAIVQHRFDFLVRVGANVKLLTDLCDYQSDKKGIVYCWPKGMMNKCEPMRLRLVQIKVRKKEPIWLLTSVLEEHRLSDAQLGKLYSLRWGVELQFRGWKQTFENHTLRCRNPERVLIEAEWSVFAMTAIEMMALREQLRDTRARPEKLSFAKCLSAFRHCLNNLLNHPSFMEDFLSILKSALIDNYQRDSRKAGRHHRTKKPPPQCKAPALRKATPEERRKAERMYAKFAM